MPRIKSLTDEECAKVIIEVNRALASPTKKRAHIRNSVVVLLMVDAGFRLGEVAKTKRGALIFAGTFSDTVTVTEEVAKLGLVRTIPTTKRLKEALRLMQEYVWAPDDVGLTDYAFYASRSKRFLSGRQIQRIVGSITKVAIGREINPHMLRHTFATRLMRSTNIRVVQELLGHRSIQSTQIYTHPNGEDLKSAIGGLE